MPKPRGGYEALPALDEEDLEAQENGSLSGSVPPVSSGSSSTPVPPRPPRRPHQRTRSSTLSVANLQVDIRHIDARLKEWTQIVGKKFAKNRNKSPRDATKPCEIIASVFGPVEVRPARDANLPLKTLDHKPPLPHSEFLVVVNNIKAAISLGINPRLNRAGTSGSYFAKIPSGKTVGIFKPKNEEPYGSLNPKWSKWFHRNFLSPFFGFGRACLVPNFSYLSEAGASLLSDKLSLYIVPPTELVSLSSTSFYYDWIDRRAYKQKKRALPEKIGSLQLFLEGYKDASDFLKEHPWPGRAARDTLDLQGNPSGRREKSRNWNRTCRLMCGRAGVDDDSDEEGDEDDTGYGRSPRLSAEDLLEGTEQQPFAWTHELMEDFRLELEKLVILDVLMRNTDRGLDNFMVKICQGPCRRPSSSNLRQDKEAAEAKTRRMEQPKAREGLTLQPPGSTAGEVPYNSRPHVHIAAIDNSLSWPIHHPNSWRSYAYGWLFLPASLIGHPFSKQTRDHFLPILTDPKWWAQTVFELRQLFSQDEDFSERMFKRQIAMLKGQAWNIVTSLRNEDEGPLELCRRMTCIVHDDEVTVADDDLTKEMVEQTATATAATRPTERRDSSPYHPSMNRSMSASVDALVSPTAPRYSRHSSERPRPQRPLSYVHTSPRPLPISKHVDLSRPTYGSASGVSMMEHMERLQKKEEDAASILGVSLPSDFDELDEEEVEAEEREMGYGSTSTRIGRIQRQGTSLDLGRRPMVQTEARRARSGSIDEVARRINVLDAGLAPQAAETAGLTKVVIVERLEEVDARPFFAKF